MTTLHLWLFVYIFFKFPNFLGTHLTVDGNMRFCHDIMIGRLGNAESDDYSRFHFDYTYLALVVFQELLCDQHKVSPAF